MAKKTTQGEPAPKLKPGNYVSIQRVDAMSWQEIVTTIDVEGNVTQSVGNPDIWEVVYSRASQKLVSR